MRVPTRDESRLASLIKSGAKIGHVRDGWIDLLPMNERIAVLKALPLTFELIRRVHEEANDADSEPATSTSDVR